MKIIVKNNGESTIKLLLPTGLVASRLGANIVAKNLQKQGIDVNKKQALALVKYLNTYRKTHKEWVLVEVESANGSSVIVKL